jgi:AcrR family transcriptional regulator
MMVRMDTRTRMLEATKALLQASPDRDISTRAVCEAVGVGAPVLYRLFGDKNGLLAAVVDYVFERYLTQKRALPVADDPVDDLYTAWDNHVAFALTNPAVYRTAYAPSLSAVPGGVEEGRQLLIERFVRCAEAGRLNTTPDQAAQAMMAACVGINLSVLSQPAIYGDAGLSRRVRNAVIRGLLADTTMLTAVRPADALTTTALQTAALIRTTPTPLTRAEAALMLQWLDIVTAAGDSEVPLRPADAELATVSRRRADGGVDGDPGPWRTSGQKQMVQ